ncbi:hypothetical protein Goshw_005866 [Gossypium schwendimanii]|uniref:Uncharacterized protein n=1 Tax=Gossypium schwendimanii TaxID=34291 RepID=A0A7J9M1E3_GOSSC|nr:hypothetical protein [Gossypium schwendimanii]
MLSWRYNRRIECYNNLDFNNRFPWHLRKISMIIYTYSGIDHRSRVRVRTGLHAMV